MLRGLLAVVLCVLLTFCSACPAQDLWASTVVRSYHLDRNAGYNEHNYGLQLELGLTPEWRIVAGEYENSFFRHSNFVGFAWLPLDLAAHTRGGLTAIVVTGYVHGQPVLVGAPTVVYERDHWGINFLSLGIVSAVQFKVKF